jgi:isopentenyl phosphate kinase
MEIELILKIGGSSISNKKLLATALASQSPDDIKAALTIDKNVINNIAAEIGTLYFSGIKNMIILTGVGSPGHFTVLRYKLHKGYLGDEKQNLGLIEAQNAVNRLRQFLLEAFLEHNVPTMQIYASSIYESEKMRIVDGYTGNIERFLKVGLIPVISGDMVPDRTMGYSVLSGDQILKDLAEKFQPKKIVFGSDVDGLYSTDPKLNPEAKLLPTITNDQIPEIINQLSGKDASGQMKGKLTEIKNLLDSGFKEILLLNITKKGVLAEAVNQNSGNFTRFY